MTVRLRAATAEDAPALALILGDWLRGTGWMPVLHTRKEDLGFLQDLIATTEVMVAEDGVAQGFLALDAEEVRALYLAPEARSRGIGRSLLIDAKSRRNRLALWVFEANRRAVAFYAREGFQVERRTKGENEEGLPDLLMTWKAPR